MIENAIELTRRMERHLRPLDGRPALFLLTNDNYACHVVRFAVQCGRIDLFLIMFRAVGLDDEMHEASSTWLPYSSRIWAQNAAVIWST